MKNQSYLNGVLTVIAVCLVLLTLSAIGIIPTASASTTMKNFYVPVNADGSINVRFEQDEQVKVNIEAVAGINLWSSYMQNKTQVPIPIKMIEPAR